MRFFGFYLCLMFCAALAAQMPAFATGQAPPPSQTAPQTLNSPPRALPRSLTFTRLPGGQYLAPVYLNGEGPFHFIIDTAASRSAVYDRTLRALPSPPPPLPERMVHGIFKSDMRPGVSLAQLEFAGDIFANLHLIHLRNPHYHYEDADGIIGLDILRRYTLAFDHKAQMITVLDSNPRKLPAYKNAKRMRLSSRFGRRSGYGLYFTQTDLAGVQVPTLLDTGASYSSINWRGVRGTNLEKYKRKLKDSWVAEGAIGTFSPKITLTIDRITIGGQQLKNHSFTIVDMNNLPVTKNGRYNLAIAGVNTLGGQDFVLDLPRKQILIARQAGK